MKKFIKTNAPTLELKFCRQRLFTEQNLRKFIIENNKYVNINIRLFNNYKKMKKFSSGSRKKVLGKLVPLDSYLLYFSYFQACLSKINLIFKNSKRCLLFNSNYSINRKTLNKQVPSFLTPSRKYKEIVTESIYLLFIKSSYLLNQTISPMSMLKDKLKKHEIKSTIVDKACINKPHLIFTWNNWLRKDFLKRISYHKVHLLSNELLKSTFFTKTTIYKNLDSPFNQKAKDSINNNLNEHKVIGNSTPISCCKNTSKIIIIVRLKGQFDINPKIKKILNILGLKKIYNCIITKNSKKNLKLLRYLNHFVSWGYPSKTTIKKLLINRGVIQNNLKSNRFSDNLIKKIFQKRKLDEITSIINSIIFRGSVVGLSNAKLGKFKLSPPKIHIPRKLRTCGSNKCFSGFKNKSINKLVHSMI
mmetsp:Transcript_6434/g.11842  ORF Transcript_6434/g.11842 Transcript_6434/m.11842 type:complete len:417 (-) Transcript_6434:1259-2509(-)